MKKQSDFFQKYYIHELLVVNIDRSYTNNLNQTYMINELIHVSISKIMKKIEYSANRDKGKNSVG